MAKKNCIENLKEVEELNNYWKKGIEVSKDMNLNTLNIIGYKTEYLNYSKNLNKNKSRI